MIERLFHLKENKISVTQEILCGITTFLTMSYILFVNPSLVSKTGMPAAGIFAATALASAICTIIIGVFANVPFAMAPGMGLNTFITYTLCIDLNFHWKEAMAIVFTAGLIHILVMSTRLRKIMVNALPYHLKIASSVGIGLFIAYVGIKNAGFLTFTSSPGHYRTVGGDTVISDSTIVPGIVNFASSAQILAVISLVIMLYLLALEKKTGESYAALLIGILAATFIGIPLNITNLKDIHFIDISQIGELGGVFMSFFGRPGLLSICEDPAKLGMASIMGIIFLLGSMVDSVGAMIGIGRVQGAELFDREEMRKFEQQNTSSKLDRALVCNSLGGCVATMLGTTTVTTYAESITGIVSGGRSGLTALVTGLMFLLCLPLANFFSIVPATAIAPALIVAGGFLMPLVSRINWKSFEEAFPAFMMIAFIPLSFSFVYGIGSGVVTHVIIQVAMGRWREIHPMLYGVTCIFALILLNMFWGAGL